MELDTQYYASKMEQYKVPHHMREDLARYIAQQVMPGSFLTAVLCNDLKGAMEKADLLNRYAVFDIVNYLYNVAPIKCWGSEENFEAWMRQCPHGKDEEHCPDCNEQRGADQAEEGVGK